MKKALHLRSQGGLIHSLKGSGTIIKTILKGDEFEFPEKFGENRNYFLFVSGMDHENEENDDFIPQDLPTEEIIEERQIIDNYKYLETKICKKKPKKLNTTHHERLSIPFERTTLKRYSSFTSQSQPKSYAKIKTLKTSRFGKTLDIEEVNPYHSFILKLKNTPNNPKNLYESYKQNKNISFTKTKKTTTTTKKQGKNLPSLSTANIYKNRNMTEMGKDKGLYSPSNLVKYKQKQNTKKNKPERTFTPDFGKKQTRKETKKGGKYLIKITTSRKQKNESKPYKMVDGSKPRDKAGKLIIHKRLTSDYRPRSGSEPRGNGNSDIDNIRQKFREKPRSVSRPRDRLSPYGRAYRPKTSDKPGTYGKPHGPKSDDKPRPYGSPRPGDKSRSYIEPKQGDKPRTYGSPRIDNKSGDYGRPHISKPGVKPGAYGGPHWPIPGNMPKPYGGPHGPKLGVKLGPYGGPHKLKPDYKVKPFGKKSINNQGLYGLTHGPKPIDKPGLYEGSKLFDRQSSLSYLGMSNGLRPTSGQGLRGPNDSNQNPPTRNKPKETHKFNDRAFAGKRDRPNVGKPRYDYKVSPSKRPGSHSREEKRISGRKDKPSQIYKTLTENNYTFSSKNLGQRPQMSFKSNKKTSYGDDNYNYYEFKHVIKQGRLNLPITIHSRRGEHDNSSQKNQINFSYNKSSQNMKSNFTNRYHRKSNLQINNKSNTRKDSRNKKSIYKKEEYLTTNSIWGRGNNNNVRRDLTSDTKKGREMKRLSQYQKFGQK